MSLIIPNRDYCRCIIEMPHQNCADCLAGQLHAVVLTNRNELGFQIHNVISDTTDGEELKSYFNSFSDMELKLLLWKTNCGFMRNPFICRYARMLFLRNNMAELRYDVRYMIKEDMIRVLMYIYYDEFKERVRSLRGHIPLERFWVPNLNLFLGNKFDIQTNKNIECINKFECPICLESECNPNEKVTLNCNHPICNECLEQYLQSMSQAELPPCCSLCRAVITELDFANESYRESITKKFMN